MDIAWLELLYQRWSYRQGHENREESRLHVDQTIIQMPECEGVEKAGKNVEHEFTLVSN